MKPKEISKEDLDAIMLKLKSYDDLLETAKLMAEKLRFYYQQKNWTPDGKIINDRNQDTCAGRYMHYGTRASDGLAKYLAFRERYLHDAVDFHQPDDYSSHYGNQVPDQIVVEWDAPPQFTIPVPAPSPPIDLPNVSGEINIPPIILVTPQDA